MGRGWDRAGQGRAKEKQMSTGKGAIACLAGFFPVCVCGGEEEAA